MTIGAGRSAKPETPRSLSWAIGCGSGNYQLNLGSSFKAAPNLQLCANPVGAFSHALESPMIRATSVVQDLRIESAPIVSDAQAKLPGIVGDFYLNVTTIGMGESINYSFTTDAIRLLHNQRVQLALT